MRLVLSPSDVAHYWANQIQSSGKNSGRTFYFERETIYSYGSHFPIAKHVSNSKGDAAVLFTFRTYSNTTAKHVSKVRNAVNHVDVIYCYNPEYLPNDNFKQWENLALIEGKKLLKAKKPEIYLSELMRLKKQAERYAEFMGVAIPESLQIALSISNKGEFEQYEQKRIELEKQAEIKRKKELAASVKRELKEWLNGERYSIYNRNGRDYLRINGEYVETSQNVKVPIDYAKKLHSKVVEKSLKVGDNIMQLYAVKSIDEKDIIIGCHSFPIKYLIEWGNKNLF